MLELIEPLQRMRILQRCVLNSVGSLVGDVRQAFVLRLRYRNECLCRRRAV